jgi:hypothetical protein
VHDEDGSRNLRHCEPPRGDEGEIVVDHTRGATGGQRRADVGPERWPAAG